MRRMLTLALVLAVASLALTAPALAAPTGASKGRMVIPAAPKLRGALAPVTGPAPRAASPIGGADADTSAAERLFLPSPATLSASTSGAPQACRAACAQTYYFCAAGGEDEACPARWALCRSACDAPSPVQSFAPR